MVILTVEVFTINGISATNSVNSGIVTVTFPSTTSGNLIGSFDINYQNTVCSKFGRVGTFELYQNGWRLIERNEIPVSYPLPCAMADYPFTSRYLPNPSLPTAIRNFLQQNNRTIIIPAIIKVPVNAHKDLNHNRRILINITVSGQSGVPIITDGNSIIFDYHSPRETFIRFENMHGVF